MRGGAGANRQESLGARAGCTGMSRLDNCISNLKWIRAMSGMSNIVIGALAAGVLMLGYLYYQSRQNTIEIKLPSVTIEKQ